jgi:hypothetical protein
MDTLNECLVIGLICMVLYHFVIKLIKKDKKKLNYRQNLILSFIFGYILHYMIKSYRLDDIYCKKVCYNDECFMICPIK